MSSPVPNHSVLPSLGLYIHLPWFERKCPYCDFNSHERDTIPEEAYIDALLADLEREMVGVQDRTLDSLFIGGGTPNIQKNIISERILGLPKD